MPKLLPSTHSNNLTPRRGIAFFAPFNADGSEQAQIPMSPSAEMTFNQEPEVAEYVSAESGVNDILDRTVVALPRTISLTCNNLSQAIKALFFVADNAPIVQASGSVTGEISPYLFADRSFSVGGATNNGAGVFGISAVSAEFYEGANADARVSSTPYSVGDFYVPATPNDHFYVCTAAGTSAASAPTFTTDGTTFTDGGATFRDVGLVAIANTSEADFEVEGDLGRINIPSTGAIATAISRLPASMVAAGTTLRLEYGYTRAAHSFEQLATKENANLDGAFYFVEQNPKGKNTVWKCPRTALAPSGDFSTKTGTDYGAATFEIAVLKPAVGAAMYQNGVPVGLGG